MTAINQIEPVPAARPLSGEPCLFSALIVPHRALNRTGFTIVMAVIGVLSLGTGLLFLSMGAWPVFSFFGLDVLAVYWAFRINFRRAAASEEITITPSELRVRRTTEKGKVSEWVLNPLWVRIDQDKDEDYGIERLYLVSRGRRLSIANFLSPDEKCSFRKALSDALHDARRGPTLNPVS